MSIDNYESSIENISPAFESEFSQPLVVLKCVITDKGSGTMVSHPVLHRPVIFEKCGFKSYSKGEIISDILNIQGNISFVSFENCDIELPSYRFIGGNKDVTRFVVKNSNIRVINPKYSTARLNIVEFRDNIIAESLQQSLK